MSLSVKCPEMFKVRKNSNLSPLRTSPIMTFFSPGAIVYKSAAETAPSVALDYNRFEYNGQELYGNFTSCDSSIEFALQNTPQFYFRNNLIRGNQGGLHLMVSSLRHYLHFIAY